MFGAVFLLRTAMACTRGARSSDVLPYVTLKGQKSGLGNPAPCTGCS